MVFGELEILHVFYWRCEKWVKISSTEAKQYGGDEVKTFECGVKVLIVFI